MVMGSSVASTAENTINTSTESASTLATNVTGTDTSTCDSFDLGKNNFKSIVSNQNFYISTFLQLALNLLQAANLFHVYFFARPMGLPSTHFETGQKM